MREMRHNVKVGEQGWLCSGCQREEGFKNGWGLTLSEAAEKANKKD